MDSTIAARVIKALDMKVESAGWGSLLLGQAIITDTSNKIKNRKQTTVGIIRKSNIKIVERGKIDTPTHKYMPAHFLGFLWPPNLSPWWNDAPGDRFTKGRKSTVSVLRVTTVSLTIYICILCNLPFSIDKEIPNKQNIIKEVFNASSSAAITVMLINKEVLTY